MKSPDRNPGQPATIVRVALIVVALAVIALFLYAIRTVLTAAFVAWIVAATLQPLASTLTRWMPRPMALVIIYLSLLAILVGILLAILPSALEQSGRAISALPAYSEQIDQSIEGADRWLVEQGVPLSLRAVLRDLQGELGGLATRAISVPLRAFEALVLLFGAAALSFYWLLDRKRLLNGLFSRLPPERQTRTRQFYYRAEARIGSFVAGLITVSVIVGILAYLGLWLLGVPFPLVLALLAALLEFIPILGPVVAAVPIIGAATAQSLGLGAAAAVFWIAVQQLESYVITPLVQKEAVRLSPFVILFAVLAGGAFAGIIGAVLAIPAAALGSMLLDEVAPPHRASTGEGG